jgi:hypothetical protein
MHEALSLAFIPANNQVDKFLGSPTLNIAKQQSVRIRRNACCALFVVELQEFNKKAQASSCPKCDLILPIILERDTGQIS